MKREKLDLKIKSPLTYYLKMTLILSILIILILAPSLIKKIYFILYCLFLLYRSVGIYLIKKNTVLYIEDNSLIVKTPFFKKEINFNEIKMFGYRKKYIKSLSGDLIINLVPLKLEYLYLNNLILNNLSILENLNYKSFIIPDLKNVETVFDYIVEKKNIKLENYKLYKQKKESCLYLNNVEIMTDNLNSKIIYCEKNIFEIDLNKNRIKTKISFYNNKMMKKYKLPRLNF